MRGLRSAVLAVGEGLFIGFRDREVVHIQLEEKAFVGTERRVECFRFLFEDSVTGTNGPAELRPGFRIFCLKFKVAADGGGDIDCPGSGGPLEFFSKVSSDRTGLPFVFEVDSNKARKTAGSLESVSMVNVVPPPSQTLAGTYRWPRLRCRRVSLEWSKRR